MQSPPFAYFGETASLLAAVSWAFSLALYSRYGRDIPPAALNLFKNCVAVIGLVIICVILRVDIQWDWVDALMLALSGILGLSIGDTAFFIALRNLGAYLTCALESLIPPLTALLAMVLLYEPMSAREWLGIGVTVTAVLCVVYASKRGLKVGQDGKRRFGIGLTAAAVAILCECFVIIFIRYASKDQDVAVSTLMRLVPAIAVLYAVAWFRNQNMAIFKQVFVKRREGMMLVLASLVGCLLTLLLMVTGLKYTKAGVSTALMSTYAVWIVPVAYFYLKEPITKLSFLATLIAVVGIVILLV